ncbi:hypothetical protein L2E82_20798 [Cichorium intybus]|uniref:Uncharacterized protein n=1 Tax=Cichorium intybus TaxID=13427 RepID=A0ACB9DUP3_CICIN|nr:hypothetical protein L2E82_20798 [Cichorium intybus]
MASKSELPHDWRSYEFDGTIGEVKKPLPTLSPRSIEEKGVERINQNDGGDKHSDARLKEKLLVRLNVEDDE